MSDWRREYRESLRIVVLGGEVVEMDLQGYLRGVVCQEMLANWHTEAYRAQAVAARSYALALARDGNRHPGAHLCTQTHCQAYRIEVRSTDLPAEQAVRDTARQVLLKNDGLHIATTFYSAACGGHSTGALERFGRDVPYLQGGRSCPCNRPRHGHGVGLCQWGAQQLALQGRDYRAILAHYYPGAPLASA